MQGLSDIRIKTEKVADKCPIHGINLIVDSYGKGEPFCLKCTQEKVKKEQQDLVSSFKTQQVKEVLTTRSLVSDPEDFKNTFANFKAEKGSKEAQVGNGTYLIAKEFIDNPSHKYKDFWIKKENRERKRKKMELLPLEHGKPLTALLYGTPGEGKSHLAMAMLNEINKKSDQKCLFIDISTLFRKIYESKQNPNSWWTEFNTQKLLTSVDVLVLDDLGSESSMTSVTTNATQFRQDILKQIFDNQKRLIVTTNLTLQQLKEVYNPKIVSRLLSDSNGRRIDFSGISDKRGL